MSPVISVRCDPRQSVRGRWATGRQGIGFERRMPPIHGIRQRMEEVAAKMEGTVPYSAAFARELVDILASIGI